MPNPQDPRLGLPAEPADDPNPLAGADDAAHADHLDPLSDADPLTGADDAERTGRLGPLSDADPLAGADDTERADHLGPLAGADDAERADHLDPLAHTDPPPDGSEPPLGTGHSESVELRRQRAFDVAWRHLAQRDRTEAELRANFERKGVDPALAEEILDELREGSYVNDASYARRFAEDRRNLDSWGSDRIERRLLQLGVDRDHIRTALAAGDGHDELDAACELLARRFPLPPDTPKDRDRALGFLVRKGYELDLAYDALRRHASVAVDR